MSIANLLNNPFSGKKQAEDWFFQHANDHREILQALQTKLGIQLIDYTLYPFNPDDLQDWLIRHQSMHNAFNGYLGYDGTDLNRVDFSDASQQQDWISQNYTEHYAARTALGI